MSCLVRNTSGGGAGGGGAAFNLVSLWKNPYGADGSSPSNVFYEQTVTIDTSQYSEYIIFWLDEWRNDYTVSPSLCSYAKCAYLTAGKTDYMYHYSGDYSRSCSLVSNGIKFGAVSTVAGLNRYCVPFLIFGVVK